MEPARPSLRQNLRSLPPTAWVLFGGTFVNRLGPFVMPFIVLYLTDPDRGFSVSQAGLALAMYGIGGVAAQFLGGWLADRIGRKNTIGFSMLGASVITLLLWQASGLLMIYALMLLLALVAEMHRPAASALIADLVPSNAINSSPDPLHLRVMVSLAHYAAFTSVTDEFSWEARPQSRCPAWQSFDRSADRVA